MINRVILVAFLLSSCGKISTEKDKETTSGRMRDSSKCIESIISSFTEMKLLDVASLSYQVCTKCNISPLVYTLYLEEKGVIIYE